VIGNYVALPGYIRFLERGGKSAAGGSFDASDPSDWQKAPAASQVPGA
jgi:hypothetical protein